MKRKTGYGQGEKLTIGMAARSSLPTASILSKNKVCLGQSTLKVLELIWEF